MSIPLHRKPFVDGQGVPQTNSLTVDISYVVEENADNSKQHH